MTARQAERVQRVLIVQTAYLGDVILATPLIRGSTTLWPQAEVDFLCIPQTASLLEGHPLIRRLLVYDKRRLARGLLAFLPTALTLRRRRYDVALVPHPSLRSALLAFLSAAPTRVGFDRNAGRWLYTDVVPYDRALHEVRRNLRLLEPFGRLPEGLRPELFPTSQDRERVEMLLGDAGDRFAAVAPGSVWPTKRWLPERFAQVCRWLAERHGLRCVVIGGADDSTLAGHVAELSGGAAVNLAGRLTPLQSAEVVRRARVLVTNDTAPLHMASAVGTPVVAVFGPTVPEFGFGPYGVPNRVAQVELPCRPCAPHGGKRCPLGTFACMRELSAEHVYRLVVQLLEETEREPA